MKKPAFTLIELMVATSIIIILSGLAFISYAGIQARGRDSQRKNDLNQIKIALSTYDTAQVPVSFAPSASSGCPPVNKANACPTETITSCTVIGTGCSAIDPLASALEPSYMRDVPVDPKNTGSYVYKYTSSPTNLVANQAFTLTATLENTNDKKGWGSPQGSAWVANGYVIQND